MSTSLARIEITGMAEAQAAMRDFSPRRLAAVKATAATRVAVAVRDELRAEMPRVFDRPTPYTLNSLYLRRAEATRPVAEVWVKDDRAGSGTPATRYLLPQVEGGQRGNKRFEVALRAAGALPAGWFVVPAEGAQRDAYGNWARGQIIQVLSQLRITLTAGFTRNMSFDRGRAVRAQRKAGGRFFVIRPDQKGRKRPPGVYQREFLGKNVTPVALFVTRVNYQQRWAFGETARRVAEREGTAQYLRAINESAARLAARNANS